MPFDVRDLGRLVVLLICAALHCVSTAASGDEGSIRKMIVDLVSTNEEPPKAVPHEEYEFPAGFDLDENERVKLTSDMLRSNGVEAFPYLVEALDNAQYSYSYTEHRDAVRIWHVREICLEIIESQVEVYLHCVRRFSRKDIPRWLPCPRWSKDYWPTSTKNAMEKWLLPRKAMTLCDLQREAVEWAVETEQSRGFSSSDEKDLVLGWYKPLQMRLTFSKKEIRVGVDGIFLDEGDLSPKDSDWERWQELIDNDSERRRANR